MKHSLVMSNPPVFLLSVERSGSTLLRYILDSHPEIGSPGELVLGSHCAALINLYRRLLDGDYFPRDTNIETKVRDKVRSILGDLMNEYLILAQKTLWCDKSPANLLYLEYIREVFPDSKFVFLYRNCLDTVASSVEAGRFGYMQEHQEYIVRNPDNFVRAMIENWADKTERLIWFERIQSHSVRISYENLVATPTEAVRPIIEFLGLKWFDDIVSESLNIHHFSGGGDLKITRAHMIHTKSIGSGSTLPLRGLPASLVVRVNSLHKKLGYGPINNPRIGQQY